MDTHDIQRALNANGFPCGAVDGDIGPRTQSATRLFQLACNMDWLAVDGIPGPKTQAALAELPHLSEHFVVAELRSKGNGNCYIKRELLQALEAWRAQLGGRPMRIISAYRDPAHNAGEGGATHSMHLYGLAADVDPLEPWKDTSRRQLFSGIGDRHGAVSHVDLRHLSSFNLTPGASPRSPARWTY